MFQEYRGVVLQTVPYQQRSAVVTVYTSEGPQKFMGYGMLRRVPLLVRPPALVRIQTYPPREGTQLLKPRNWEVWHPYQRLWTAPERLTWALWLVRLWRIWQDYIRLEHDFETVVVHPLLTLDRMHPWHPQQAYQVLLTAAERLLQASGWVAWDRSSSLHHRLDEHLRTMLSHMLRSNTELATPIRAHLQWLNQLGRLLSG